MNYTLSIRERKAFDGFRKKTNKIESLPYFNRTEIELIFRYTFLEQPLPM